jgi:hypothetical protein
MIVLASSAVAVSAEPVLKFRPDSYAIHQMHSHHLSAMHHTEVLQAYSGDAAAIPKEALESHVKLIRRDVVASRKSLDSLPKEKLEQKEAAASVKGIKQSHAQTLKAAKAINDEIAKDAPDYKVVQQHAKTMVTALRRGEGHIHAVHQPWQASIIHRRLHPGTPE